MFGSLVKAMANKDIAVSKVNLVLDKSFRLQANLINYSNDKTT